MRGIRKWRENREIKKEQQRIAEDRTGIGDHDRGTFTGDHPDAPTKTPEQGGWHPGVGGNGNTGGGFSGAGAGTGASGPPGRNYNRGGRIGYERGRVVNPGGYQGEIPEGFLEGLPNEDYQKIIEEYLKQKEHEERMRNLAPSQWVAEGGRIGYEPGGVVEPGKQYYGKADWEIQQINRYGVSYPEFLANQGWPPLKQMDATQIAAAADAWKAWRQSQAEGGIASLV